MAIDAVAMEYPKRLAELEAALADARSGQSLAVLVVAAAALLFMALGFLAVSRRTVPLWYPPLSLPVAAVSIRKYLRNRTAALRFSRLAGWYRQGVARFFVFWESVLVPMYFIIAIWGGQRRAYAAIKFIIYTLIGSVLMFLGILTLYTQHYAQFQTYSFHLADLMRTSLSPGLQWWVFWAFFVGFAVKVPMFPFHTWLPDAHTEAPTAGSVILASVLLKMGTYGFLRFSLPLLPESAKNPTI